MLGQKTRKRVTFLLPMVTLFETHFKYCVKSKKSNNQFIVEAMQLLNGITKAQKLNLICQRQKYVLYNIICILTIFSIQLFFQFIIYGFLIRFNKNVCYLSQNCNCAKPTLFVWRLTSNSKIKTSTQKKVHLRSYKLP